MLKSLTIKNFNKKDKELKLNLDGQNQSVIMNQDGLIYALYLFQKMVQSNKIDDIFSTHEFYDLRKTIDYDFHIQIDNVDFQYKISVESKNKNRSYSNMTWAIVQSEELLINNQQLYFRTSDGTVYDKNNNKILKMQENILAFYKIQFCGYSELFNNVDIVWEIEKLDVWFRNMFLLSANMKYMDGDLYGWALDLEYNASNFFNWLNHQESQFTIEFKQILRKLINDFDSILFDDVYDYVAIVSFHTSDRKLKELDVDELSNEQKTLFIWAAILTLLKSNNSNKISFLLMNSMEEHISNDNLLYDLISQTFSNTEKCTQVLIATNKEETRQHFAHNTLSILKS